MSNQSKLSLTPVQQLVHDYAALRVFAERTQDPEWYWKIKPEIKPDGTKPGVLKSWGEIACEFKQVIDKLYAVPIKDLNVILTDEDRKVVVTVTAEEPVPPIKGLVEIILGKSDASSN